MPDLGKVFSNYDGVASDLIPLLQDVQDELGYVTSEAMSAIARFLRIPESKVYGVTTFYKQFHLTRQGRHKIKICQGTACHVRGSHRVMDAVERRLGIAPGQTTEDHKCSLEGVACFGSCALAPVMVVGDQVHGRMTPEEAGKIIGDLE